jgi:CHAT domain-containing protein
MFNPLLPYIKTNKVLIAADDVLYGFPFEALVTKVPDKFEYNSKNYSLNDMSLKQFSGDILLFCEYSHMEYLGKKYNISYIPTASTLNILRGGLKEENAAVEGVIAFADPVFSTGEEKQRWLLKPLTESAAEAEIFLKQIGKGKIYKGLETTEENVWKANLGKAKYILFSTHGFLAKEDENVVEPSLVLTLINNPEGYNGLLGMIEASGLRLNSDVVILSACNSAGESGKGGEGFAGMARSFLFAGSQAVVASHWQVDSKATKILIENYEKFLKTKGRLEALEAARNVVKTAVVEYGKGKRKIKVSYAHPYFWAAFVLLGER